MLAGVRSYDDRVSGDGDCRNDRAQHLSPPGRGKQNQIMP
ncbi:hypothetical protein M2232_001493 [Bradyrhizobium japonicum]|nr:hypothetical protein [Bradyrhizobium japonicum]MCW2342575.1 hypothetical protein [Bradyrhizobium japonicum]